MVAAAFEKIMFTPEKTPDGPRYRLDGTGNLGRLLGLDDDAKSGVPSGESGTRDQGSEGEGGMRRRGQILQGIA